MKTISKTLMFSVIVFVLMFVLPSYRSEAQNNRMLSVSENQGHHAKNTIQADQGVTPQESMVATLIVPGLGKSWQGHSTYEGEYTTLFVGNNAQGDWPHCSGSIDRIEVQSLSGGPTIIEDFNDPGAFTQVGTTVYISGGKAVFDHFYMSGGPQFVYRSIPAFSGPVSIKVIGQLNWAENNCGVIAGIADDHIADPAQPTSYPGVAYRFFGGGCSVSGPLVSAPGTDVETKYTSDGCSFTPDGAPWFTWGTPFEADLIETGGSVYTVSGQVTDAGGDPFQGVFISTDIGLGATSNASGYYTFTNMITGTYTITPVLAGYVFTPTSLLVSVPPSVTGVDFVGTPKEYMTATLKVPSLEKSWQGQSTYDGIYTTLFIGNNAQGDWPHCSGSIDRIEVQSLSGGPTIIEDFNNPSVFKQVGTTVYVSGGKAVFNHFYMDGGPQFVYRSIPAFSGPVEIKVIGQVDWAENNCGVIAGIGDDNLPNFTQPTSYPGIAYRFFGGGCSISGPLVSAPGTDVETKYTSDGCSFTPDGAPWFAWSTPFEADLNETGSMVYTVSGQVADADGNPLQGVTVSTDIGLGATTNASGYYTFANMITGTYTITPTLTRYVFTPTSRSVSVLPRVAGADFVGTSIPNHQASWLYLPFLSK